MKKGFPSIAAFSKSTCVLNLFNGKNLEDLEYITLYAPFLNFLSLTFLVCFKQDLV